MIVPLQLLLQIGSKIEVAARWYEVGRAVGMDKEILEECASYPPKEAIVEIFKWWVRNRQVTWKDVSEVLNNVGLEKLATYILRGGKYIILLVPSFSAIELATRKVFYKDMFRGFAATLTFAT